jgi:hypothetical protein
MATSLMVRNLISTVLYPSSFNFKVDLFRIEAMFCLNVNRLITPAIMPVRGLEKIRI